MKLTNRRQLKGKHNRNDNDTKKGVRISYCFAKDFFLKRKYTNITDPLTFPSLGEKNNGRSECSFLEDDEGEADSMKSEMMVASFDQLTAGRWGFVLITATLRPG